MTPSRRKISNQSVAPFRVTKLAPSATLSSETSLLLFGKKNLETPLLFGKKNLLFFLSRKFNFFMKPKNVRNNGLIRPYFVARLSVLLFRVCLLALSGTCWERLTSPDATTSTMFLACFLDNLVEELALLRKVCVRQFLISLAQRISRMLSQR